MIDSHCHLTDRRFDEDRNAVLRSAFAAGVTAVVTIASDVSDSEAVADLVAKEAAVDGGAHPPLRGTAGIHPHEAAAAPPGAVERIREIISTRPGIVAVGETGLDFFYDHAPREAQIRLFEAHIELATDLGVPVVVHSRSADEETKAVLRNAGPAVTGVLHCYTAGDELLDAGLSAGWYVSFSGIVSFKKFDGAHQVRRVPRDRLLVETDAPYLAPVPFRGKRNEPAFVEHVVRAVADHRGEEAEDVARYTASNAARFYGIEAELSGVGRS